MVDLTIHGARAGPKANPSLLIFVELFRPRGVNIP
jgi:hypothetical protein